MEVTERNTAHVTQQLRDFAAQHDAFVEADVVAITGWSVATVVSYRKRGELEAIRVGKNFVYPREQFLERGRTKPARRGAARGVL